MIDYVYDTEFLDDGATIELISIGIVEAETGRHYYAVNADMDTFRVFGDAWLWSNVCPSLPLTDSNGKGRPSKPAFAMLDRRDVHVKPKWVIANEVREFIGGHDRDENRLWAYYGAYDHVALAQLYGPMKDLPANIPMWTHDLMQLFELVRAVRQPGNEMAMAENTNAHDALTDAMWGAAMFDSAKATLRSAGINL